MFLKNIGLIEKNIGTFENKHTVDCLRAYGPLAGDRLDCMRNLPVLVHATTEIA